MAVGTMAVTAVPISASGCPLLHQSIMLLLLFTTGATILPTIMATIIEVTDSGLRVTGVGGKALMVGEESGFRVTGTGGKLYGGYSLEGH